MLHTYIMDTSDQTYSIQFNSVYLRRGQCKLIKHMIIHGLKMPELAKRLFFICSPLAMKIQLNKMKTTTTLTRRNPTAQNRASQNKLKN